MLSKSPDLCAVLSGAGQAYPFEPKPVALVYAPVLNVLSMRTSSEVGLPIVQPIPVDVINVRSFCWPKNESVKRSVLAVRFTQSVTLWVDPPLDATDALKLFCVHKQGSTPHD